MKWEAVLSGNKADTDLQPASVQDGGVRVPSKAGGDSALNGATDPAGGENVTE